MNKQELIAQIKRKKSFLCIGLDSDIDKIPKHLLGLADPVFEFNKAIIDATKDYCVAYKPNIAFYESRGIAGWQSLQKTIEYIPKDIFTIADAKRGDIGNTANHYAKAFFEQFHFDAITIAPYMGKDSVVPFLNYKDKWGIILALTSNEGALDFQFISTQVNNRKLFEKVILRSKEWGSDENMMYVVGATRGETIAEVRKLVPNHFFLVPGVGAQGGNLNEVVKFGINKDCGLLINSSREIIFASDSPNFAIKSAEKAREIQHSMEMILKKYQIV
jgi:orotidine-5'-phosphate decarboxylase